MSIQEKIKLIHNLLARSISRENSYNRRSRGFISEISFKKKCIEENIPYFDGGWLFFKNQNLSIDKKANYVTVSFDNKERYIDFYKILSECPLIDKLYFMETLPENEWGEREIPIPCKEKDIILATKYRVYEFRNTDFYPTDLESFLNEYEDKPQEAKFYNINSKKKELLDYLELFRESDLLDIYANRFLIDILMKEKIYSDPMDFDAIILKNENYYVVETKEKDPAREKGSDDPDQWYFGWDSIRFAWYLYLRMTTHLYCYNAIMEIKDQEEREFYRWCGLEILDCCRSVSWNNAVAGGSGMGVGRGSTMKIPYNAFEDF